MKPGEFPERIWRLRPARLLALLAVFLLLATITRPPPPVPPPGPGSGIILATPVLFDAENPSRRDAGALHFLAGWVLASEDERFGGISGLHVEGGEAIAVSDVGMMIRFPLPARPGALPVRFAPLADGPGPRRRKSSRDSEGLLVIGDGLWVSFERHNMIWRYDRAGLRARSAARPAPMRRWRSNSGPEALVRLADGRFLVLAEGRSDSNPYSDVVLFAGDPAVPGTPATRLRYRRPAGYRATDAALLPDGRVLILNRRFDWRNGLSGFSARLVTARLGRDGVIEGRELASLEPPLAVDNMEALAVTREGARTIVWIASDDNFSPLQRTLLLKFELME